MITPRRVGLALLLVAGLLIVIQLVPYGRSHNNPAGTREPAWDSPATRRLARDGCFDCHSNQTRWRWYTSVAPVSWLTQNDVNGGRETMNFSEWDRGAGQPELGDMLEQVRGGGMPPWYFKLIHSESRLSKAEREQLASGLKAIYAKDRPSPGKGGG